MDILKLLNINDDIYSSDVLDYMWDEEKIITKELTNDLIFLKRLGNKEFLLYKKFIELNEFMDKSSGTKIMIYKIKHHL